MTADSAAFASAKALVEAAGYVVLKSTSYRRAQERQRAAEALRDHAERHAASMREWMERDVFPRERYMTDRCTFLYGVARAHGASAVELAGDLTGKTCGDTETDSDGDILTCQKPPGHVDAHGCVVSPAATMEWLDPADLRHRSNAVGAR